MARWSWVLRTCLARRGLSEPCDRDCCDCCQYLPALCSTSFLFPLSSSLHSVFTIPPAPPHTHTQTDITHTSHHHVNKQYDWPRRGQWKSFWLSSGHFCHQSLVSFSFLPSLFILLFPFFSHPFSFRTNFSILKQLQFFQPFFVGTSKWFQSC